MTPFASSISEAALTAAQRGHRVTLLEQRDRLGGASVPVRNPPFKRELDRLPAWSARELATASAQVIFGAVCMPESVAALKPDVVVYAIGSVPVGLNVPGAAGGRVVQAIDLLQADPGSGRDIVVVGAGFVGCETAVHLGRLDNRVQLVTRRRVEDLATDLNYTVRLALRRLLEDAGVQIVPQSEVREVRERTVLIAATADNGVAVCELPADLVVAARGFAPSYALADALRRRGLDVRMAGDCAGGDLIYGAVHQGFAIGSAL
jgi:pyruvate/2-oxoglutarate dehydrogenase complex dihydrolipoamide dehydrogenase (E3) component